MAAEQPTAPAEAAALTESRSAYIAALNAEAAVYPAVPNVEVAFDFSYVVRLPSGQADALPSVIRTLAGPLGVLAARLRKQERASGPAFTDCPVLAGVHGKLLPGTLTLLLAPPGHGKTSLLRAIAGHIAPAELQGDVRYNGVPAAEVRARGVNLSLLAAYVDQEDAHLPFLTVRETIAFAAALSTVEAAAMPHPLLIEAAAERTDRVLKLLHLTGCEHTLVGNNMVRGCSGGERKRVSVAEALVSNARILCLDEISTGLDASVTFDIVACISAWARAMRGTVIMALQQPTPEVYSLCDNVSLLREGATLYHGPREALPAHWTRLGFAPPTLQGGEGVAGADMADWLIELLTSPTEVLRRQSGGALAPDAPRTTAALAAAWRSAAPAEAAEAAKADAATPAEGLELASPFAQAQYGRAYPRAAASTFLSLVHRQALLSARNRTVLMARTTAACIASVILGLVWLHLGTAQGGAKLGLFVFALAQMSFANFPEVTWVVEYKFVGLKQLRAGLYPAWSYTLAATLLQAPIAAVESAAFSLILYFMADLARDGGRWAFFYLVVLCANVAVGSLFRLFAYVVPTAEAAMSAPGPFVALQLVFAGFLIPPAQMGTKMWMIWMYYVSTFAYGARSMAHNEFGSALYDVFPAQNDAAAKLTPGGVLLIEQGATNGTYYFSAAACNNASLQLECGSMNYGALTLRALNINAPPPWKWGGIGFLIGFALIINAMSARVVGKKALERNSRNVGSSYTRDEAEGSAGANGDAVKLAVAPESAVGTLPFTRIALAWRALSYTVDTASGRKQLLHEVSGVAQPGRLLALMGASGAGKTTLLDVIACRKTAGVTEGSISLNGFPLERNSFARLTAYCEQQDVHSPLATVAEALHFSAALRLPGTVAPDVRAAFVDEVMDLLELRPVAGRLVGLPGAPGGLSPSQRKILTVAVELVSNAPILFLDEPTSSLDARAAAMVIRVVRKITNTGRTVVTTIHQPSTEVFFNFDDMLLMQRGGWMAYFGPVGAEGASLVAYLSAVPGSHARPAGMNPASWMLDVLSEVSDGASLAQQLLASEAWRDASTALDAACTPAPDAKPFAFDAMYARTFAAQLRIVFLRTWASYSRSLGYILARIKILFILNMLFATVWYKSMQAVDCAPAQLADAFRCANTPLGMQTIVAIIFINALFISVVCVSSLMPYMMRERNVFYRERASFMYAPEVHGLAHLLAEMPWLLLTVLIVLTPLYFMVGFEANAAAYFFYVFVIWLTVMCFVSLGQWSAALFSTGALAQAVISLVLPLAALFAGVYLPKEQLPNGKANGHPHVFWRWAFYIDPVAHAVEALVPSRFIDTSRPSTVNHTIAVPRGAGVEKVDALQFLAVTRGSHYEDRWNQVGYLIAIMGGLQLFHMYCLRYKIINTR